MFDSFCRICLIEKLCTEFAFSHYITTVVTYNEKTNSQAIVILLKKVVKLLLLLAVVAELLKSDVSIF